MTTAGFVVPLVTGLISACSSGLIIYVISRSQQKLSTTYHRIMAFMSTFDIISSLFIALGTIMMPSDNIYPFAGPMLGNKVTCQIQGWFTTFGFAGTTASNACLSWYFVCKIAFKLDANFISKRIEPLIYLYVMSLALFIPSFYLSKDLLNPNSSDSFCTIVPYPESCDQSAGFEWSNCDWGDRDEHDLYRYIYIAAYHIFVQFLLIVVGMSIIFWTVHRNSKEIRQLNIVDEASTEEDIANSQLAVLKDLRFSRVLIFQALMYIGAYILTWSLNCISAQFGIASFGLDAANYVLFPIQGFWNLLIFLYDKSYLIRQHDKKMSVWKAMIQSVSSPGDIPGTFISNVSKIDNDTSESVGEINLISVSENMSDIELSQIGSGFDELSELRDPMMSVADSSSEASEKFSTLSAALSFEMKSRNNLMMNNRLSRAQFQKETKDLESSNVAQKSCLWINRI
jgi:hypothetical protein